MIEVDIVNEVSKIADITKVKAGWRSTPSWARYGPPCSAASPDRAARVHRVQVKPRKRGIGRNPRTGKKDPSGPHDSLQASKGANIG
jgi:hypothetical protein